MRPTAFLLCLIIFLTLATGVKAQVPTRPPVPMDAHSDFGLEPTTAICEGSFYQFAGNSLLSHVWTGPNGFYAVEQNPILTHHAGFELSGTYYVTVTSTYGSSSFKTELTVYPELHPTISADVSICEGESTVLTADGGTPGVTYNWAAFDGLSSFNTAVTIAKPAVTTKYSVTISNIGCTEVKTVKVTVLKPPMASAGNDIDLEKGDVAKLHGRVLQGDSVKYYWTPSDYLDDPFSLTPNVSATVSTKYTFHVESLGGCGIATAGVNVTVYPKITIPNTFSPKDDGWNDLWNINKLSEYPKSVLTVFTRTGEPVFQSTGNAISWDGRHKGKPVSAGAYYYVLDLKNTGRPVRSGWVMLIR